MSRPGDCWYHVTYEIEGVPRTMHRSIEAPDNLMSGELLRHLAESIRVVEALGDRAMITLIGTPRRIARPVHAGGADAPFNVVSEERFTLPESLRGSGDPNQSKRE